MLRSETLGCGGAGSGIEWGGGGALILKEGPPIKGTQHTS